MILYISNLNKSILLRYLFKNIILILLYLGITSNKYIDIKINIRLKCKTEIYKMLVEEK